MISDIGKLVVITIIVITVLVGLMLGTFQNVEAAWGVIGTLIGYIVGNGVNAVRGNAPSPVIVPKLHEGEAVTLRGPVEAPKHLAETGADDGSE